MIKYNDFVNEEEAVWAMGTSDGTIGEIQSRIDSGKQFIMRQGRKFWVQSVSADKKEQRTKAKRWSDTMVKYKVVEMTPQEAETYNNA